MERPFNRREFLRLTTHSGLALLLSRCANLTREPSSNLNASDFLSQYSPIDRTLGDKVPQAFSGDSFARPHEILWDLSNFYATHQVEGKVEEAPLVIIGGGVSGLFSAFEYREHRPIVLEQAARFGGNAKGQSWRGLDYALGSAYIDRPHPGTPMAHFYNELKLDEITTERKTTDPVAYKNKLYFSFWDGESDPANKAKYQKIGKFFSDLYHEKERAFPLIPSLNAEEQASVRYFDQWDLHTFLSKLVGGKLPPQLETAFEHYCWSTYAGSAKELSSAAALNFLAQEIEPIRVSAGGNARIAERLLERLTAELPLQNLRAGCLVVKVKVEGNGVLVHYLDPQNKLRAIRARSAILSCPKFVANKILEEIEPERVTSIEKLRYRSYMTANLLLKGKSARHFYDLFMIGKGKINLNDVKESQQKQNATDFVMANFASPHPDATVLTFYRAFPADGMRKELIMPDSYNHYYREFEQQIDREILPMMNFKKSQIVDLRLTRWGHALPLAEKGIYSGNTIANLRKPFRDRVFFIEQDNWAYPSLQTGATDCVLMKKEITKALSQYS